MTEHKKRGRPSREDVIKTTRRRKGALGQHKKRLVFPDELLENGKYVGRFINDDGNRIHEMTVEDDWDLVDAQGKNVGMDKGSALQYHVGTKKDGSPLVAYGVRKLKSFYEEDQAAKQAEVDEKMKPLREGIQSDSRLAGKSYVPSEGIKL